MKFKIINKSKQLLIVACKDCGLSETDTLEVKRKAVLRLNPGRYNITMHYAKGNLDLRFKENASYKVDDIPSPVNNRFIAKMIVVNYAEQAVRITCKDRISVANILEGISY